MFLLGLVMLQKLQISREALRYASTTSLLKAHRSAENHLLYMLATMLIALAAFSNAAFRFALMLSSYEGLSSS